MRPIKGKKEEGAYAITQLSLILEQHIKTDQNYRKNIKTDRASFPIWASPLARAFSRDSFHRRPDRRACSQASFESERVTSLLYLTGFVVGSQILTAAYKPV